MNKPNKYAKKDTCSDLDEDDEEGSEDTSMGDNDDGDDDHDSPSGSAGDNCQCSSGNDRAYFLRTHVASPDKLSPSPFMKMLKRGNKFVIGGLSWLGKRKKKMNIF
ncbi:uncharacterized protein DS421_12g364200 [Arachis hypogaea]|nr:uncharacterized protein DS421_12g364200 [Arachis hypogaea]